LGCGIALIGCEFEELDSLFGVKWEAEAIHGTVEGQVLQVAECG
jgi:hypothetical protein